MRMPGVRHYLRMLVIVAILMVAVGAAPSSAMATISSHITTPFVPAHVYRNVPITVSGQIDKAAATGQIKLLFYQKFGDTWKLQKSEYARWSGYTDTTTKFLCDVSLPYTGTWRIGASYGGNTVYPCDYTYRDIVVEAPYAAGLGLTLSDTAPPVFSEVWVLARVLNQVGQPLSGAAVSFVWNNPSMLKPPGYVAPAPKVYYTDADGYVECEGSTGFIVGARCTVTATATHGGHSVTKSASYVTQSQIWYFGDAQE